MSSGAPNWTVTSYQNLCKENCRASLRRKGYISAEFIVLSSAFAALLGKVFRSMSDNFHVYSILNLMFP